MSILVETLGASVLKRIGLISSLVVLAVAPLATWSLARYYQRQFETLSAQAAVLRVEQSKFADADELSRSYLSHALLDKWYCEGTSCHLRIVLANLFTDRGLLSAPDRKRSINCRALRQVGIRPAMVVVDISVIDNVVQEVQFTAAYQTPRRYWLWGGWDAVKELPPALKCDLFAIQRHRAYAASSGHTEPLPPPGPFVKATFQPDISESERSHCQRIRFACMTSLDDCAKNPQLGAGPFMPFIYQDIRADKVVRSAIPEYSRVVDACFNRR